MSRVELGGFGLPIPNIALLDPNLSADVPVQSLRLVDGEPFLKADWVALGYTHYEVWSAGAAGGQGGDVGRKLYWPITYLRDQLMPSNVFTAWKEMLLYFPFAQSSWFPPMVGMPRDEATYRALYWDYGHFWQPGEYLPPGVTSMGWVHEGYRTFDQWADWQGSNYSDIATWLANQNGPHYGMRRQIDKPYLIDEGSAIGGGGGGGGVHVMSGELADLPNSVPVSVGKAGVDAPPGHVFSNGVLTPLPSQFLNILGQQRGDWGHAPNHPELYEATYRAWTDIFPGPPPSFAPPAPGGDGGASSFGAVCLASGGKGGGPSLIWTGTKFQISAKGGDGGRGGVLVAGGGGLGSASDSPGGNGTWDGAVGTGGGGGRGGATSFGGTTVYGSGENITDLVSLGGLPAVTARLATDGGRGALSYADTSVFGRGERKDFFIPPVYGGSLSHRAGISSGPADQPTATQIVPGGGGGVRINRKLPVGSHTEGYSPDGAVLIRLLKLD